MNRIDQRFQALRSHGRKALIPFVVSGDGGMETTIRCVSALEEAGADVVELGMPFSDPIADGPTIQRASQRALKGGFSFSSLFQTLESLRRRSSIPLVLMGYFNPILKYGVRRFCRNAADAGADGLLIVDLPLEQLDELEDPQASAGLHTILLAAPTTGMERAGRICVRGGGFIYYVSLTGVTGTEKSLNMEEISENVRRIKSGTSLPVVVGFGISAPAEAREAARFSDGVVVGSALVRFMERRGEETDLYRRMASFLADLRRAMDEPS